MLYDPCETRFSDDLGELSVEGLYCWIQEQKGETEIDHKGFGYPMVGDYVWDCSPNCDRGSDYFDELVSELIDMWREEDEQVFEWYNHNCGRTMKEYQTVLDFREFCHDIA